MNKITKCLSPDQKISQNTLFIYRIILPYFNPYANKHKTTKTIKNNNKTKN